jgi:glycosyltransferase involved in cell wall biosynthesis
MGKRNQIEINQLLAGFARDDAISNYARRLRRIFEGWGYRSRIFVDTPYLEPALTNEASPFGEEPAGEQILIYHFSIGSASTDYYLAAPGKRVVIYHNITPPDFYYPFAPDVAATLAAGQEQLSRLAEATDLALADSEYNRRELEAAGFRESSVLPLPLDPTGLEVKPAKKILRRLGTRRDHILFVGRIAPNKKFEDLWRAFQCYTGHCRPGAKLILVGKYKPTDGYYCYLRSLMTGPAFKNVVFVGQATQNEMVACYRRAGVFLSMSEHEGFGLPLLEAMFLGVPVLAYAAAAVPETMGGAGVIFTEKDYPAVAEMAALLVEDGSFRRTVLAGQRRRIESFQSISSGDTLRKLLASWLGE